MVDTDCKEEEIGKFVPPKGARTGYELLRDDLQFLSGMAVPMDILNALNAANITKIHQILCLKENEKKNINQSELKKLQQMICNNFYNSAGINSLSKSVAKVKNIKYFSTGIDALDQLIHAKEPGIPSQSITSFIGASSSGKTLLLTQIMAICVLNGGSAVFIDTNNEFDAMRLYKVLSKQTKNQQNIQTAMQRIDIYSVCTLREIIQLFDTNSFKMKLNKYDMIIIDNLSLKMIELKIGYLAFSQISKVSRTLKYFSKKHNLAVITSSLANNQKFRSEFWINSSESEMCRNYLRFVDQEIHLMLTPTFGKVMPVLTKSYRQQTFVEHGLVLAIDEDIVDAEVQAAEQQAAEQQAQKRRFKNND